MGFYTHIIQAIASCSFGAFGIGVLAALIYAI
jgi:hypothetical protein